MHVETNPPGTCVSRGWGLTKNLSIQADVSGPLPDLSCNLQALGHIALGVNLGDVGL